jgi:hypothetical protein
MIYISALFVDLDSFRAIQGSYSAQSYCAALMLWWDLMLTIKTIVWVLIAENELRQWTTSLK